MTLQDDSAVEGEEVVNLTLSSPTNGAALQSPSSAVLTIADNDTAQPGQLKFQVPDNVFNESTGTATGVVVRVGGSGGTVRVDFATSNVTAQAGSDYTATAGTLTFADGETSKAIAIAIIDDSLVESLESFKITLSNPSGGATLGDISQLGLFLQDNDTAPSSQIQFSAWNYSVGENDGTAVITITRTGSLTNAVTVQYTTSDGSAIAGQDYTAVSGDLTFNPGDTNRTFIIPILNNTAVETNEALGITLSSPTGGAMLATPSTATLTITDNDQAPTQPGRLQFSAANIEVSEGSGVLSLHVKRVDGSDGNVSVQFSVSVPGSISLKQIATAGADFTGSTTGIVTLGNSETQKAVVLTLVNDNLVEMTESFLVTLSQPAGGAMLGSAATVLVSILDDDLPQVAPATPSLKRLELAGAGFGKSEEHYRDFVRKAYARFLGREPDEQGFTFWVSLMQLYETSNHAQGLRQEKIEAGFLDSAEYKGRYGGIGEGWIRGIYKDLLSREADPSGQQFWLTALRQGASPTHVAEGFTASDERLRNRVANTYRTLLGRDPDAAGLAYWVAIFKHGGTTEDINSGFVGSPEYYAKGPGAAGNPAQWVREAYLDILFRPAATSELDYWLRFLNG